MAVCYEGYSFLLLEMSPERRLHPMLLIDLLSEGLNSRQRSSFLTMGPARTEYLRPL